MELSGNAYLGVESLARLAAFGFARPCTTRQVAQWIGRSEPYTEALMACLQSAGFVTAADATGGGYYLSRPANRISVAEVVQAFDDPHVPPPRHRTLATEAEPGIEEMHGTDLLWEALKWHILLFLDDISLADVMPEADDDGSEGDRGSRLLH